MTSPTVAQVGAMLRARTRDSEGVEQGTFTPDTRPTDAQVTELIAVAADIVTASVGAIPVDSPCEASTWVVVALGTVCLIEKSYFPEQIETGRSAYEQYRQEYEAVLTQLARCLGVTIGVDGQQVASFEFAQVPITMSPTEFPPPEAA